MSFLSFLKKDPLAKSGIRRTLSGTKFGRGFLKAIKPSIGGVPTFMNPLAWFKRR